MQIKKLNGSITLKTLNMKNLSLSFKRMLKGSVTLLLCFPFLALAQPTEEEILASIELGVEWLVLQQNADGSWGTSSSYDQVAYTGFALTKLCDRAYELYYESPFDPEYLYAVNVAAGFDYLFSQARDDLTGIYMAELGTTHQTYNAAVALMAVAASYTPDRVISYAANPIVDGMTFAQLVDQIVIYFRDGQNDNNPANTDYGGWGYFYNHTGRSDNSHTGYVVLALRYAEDFGAVIPTDTKTKLDVWIDYIQNDVNGDTNDGGSGYVTPIDWVNQLKTGNLLFEMSFVGDEVGDLRVQDALDYIERHWDDDNVDPGWHGHNQAMFCLMKGFESFAIETIEVSSVERNWFEEFATAIIAAQLPAGYWPWDYWGDEVLSTCWALFVLERIAPPPPVVHVDFDIHPTSWPNPINTKSQGLTPTAILGTEDFDVTTIDPATLYLDLPEGMVYPVTWALEDVTMPAGNEWECNDTEMGPDGYMDLTVKFNTQELVAALGEVNDGDVLIVVIKGNLMDDGQAIEGDDCILIINKGTKDAIAQLPLDYALSQNYPNPFMGTTRIEFAIPQDGYVTLQVFDLLGNEVTTLTEAYYPAGEYTIMLDAKDFESGTYLYRLSTDQFNETRRMLLIK